MKAPLLTPDFTGVTKINIGLQCSGILGIVSAIGCFAFIKLKLDINHIIKKLLLFAAVQQAFFSGTFLWSIISLTSGIQNKFICWLAFTSIRASNLGSQTSISMISIIRSVKQD